jgi:hypothetical protein
VSAFFTRATAAVFIEFTDNAAHIVTDERALDLAIERDATGALKQASADSVRDALKLFAKNPGREQAICLLPARGVSIRRISLPASSKDDVDRLLPLQIDAQFPLSSEELAWGYSPLNSRATSSMQELLVAAAKKDSVQQYREIISAAGFEPLFAIAALSRAGVCPARPTRFGLLEIGNNTSELVTFDESGPATLRVVALGAENTSADPLLNTIRSNGAVEKIFVSGKASAIWSARIAQNIPSEALPVANGQSSAIAGLRESMRRGSEPLLIHTNRESVQVQRAPAQWRWAAAACALLLISIGLRYAEPIIRKARLESTIAALQARQAKLPKIDREAGFLNYIHNNQPDYLDIVGALAGITAPGMKVDAMTISRRGEFSMRGSAQGAQAVTTLRSKMIDSGYFASVVIDEQTPNQQNQQQVSFRLSAQVRPEPERKAAAAAKPKPDKNAATNKVSAPSPGPGFSPPPDMPMPMPGPPPGMPIQMPPGSMPPPSGPPPGAVSIPAGVQLPPGVTLPPGVVIREGPPQ